MRATKGRAGGGLLLRHEALLADLRTLLVGQRLAVLVGLAALHDLHVVVQLERGQLQQSLLRQLVLLVACALRSEVDADALDVRVGAVALDGGRARARRRLRELSGLFSCFNCGG